MLSFEVNFSIRVLYAIYKSDLIEYMKYKKYLPILLVTILFLGLCVPFLNHGMFFALDAVWPEKLHMVPWSNLLAYFYNPIALLNTVLPMEILTRIIYLGLFAFLLFGSLRNAPFEKSISKLYFALVITFNPYVFSRFIAGHYSILWGYALFSQLILTTFTKESSKKYLWISLWLILLRVISIHFLFLGILYMLLYLLVHLFFVKGFIKRQVLPILIGFGMVGLMSLPVVLHTPSVEIFQTFGAADLDIFYTVSDPQYGLLGNVLGLHGFWFEQAEHITLKSFIPIWPLITALFVFLSLLGIGLFAKVSEKTAQIKGVIFFVFCVFSLFLIIAPSVPLLKPIITSLYENIHVFYILREPQKAVGVLIFLYAFFGAYFLSKKSLQPMIVASIGVLLMLQIFGFFQGFYTHVRMTSYPQSWQQAKVFLQKQPNHGTILILPWHTYMPFHFAYDKKIYNGFGKYIEKENVITADNFEVHGLYSQSTDEKQKHIDGLLKMTLTKKNSFDQPVEMIPNWSEGLKAIHVSQIVLLKEADYQKYNFINTQPNIKKIYENNGVIIYQVN